MKQGRTQQREEGRVHLIALTAAEIKSDALSYLGQ
jgi:hypothetical protein